MRTIMNMKLNMIAAVIIGAVTVAHAVEQGSFEEKAGKFNWQIQADPALPNVLILGDSISIGYTLQVREQLNGKANVYRPMEGAKPENCGDTVKAVRNIDRWLEIAPKWDVIHFNWGLHDLKRVNGKETGPEIPSRIPVGQYKKNLQLVIDKMNATGAKLVFATTTAYPDGVNPCRLPADAEIYNSAALEVIKKNGIPVNDLYAFTENRLEELQIPKNVHFTPKGSKVIAAEVADRIKPMLETRK